MSFNEAKAEFTSTNNTVPSDRSEALAFYDYGFSVDYFHLAFIKDLAIIERYKIIEKEQKEKAKSVALNKRKVKKINKKYQIGKLDKTYSNEKVGHANDPLKHYGFKIKSPMNKKAIVLAQASLENWISSSAASSMIAKVKTEVLPVKQSRLARKKQSVDHKKKSPLVIKEALPNKNAKIPRVSFIDSRLGKVQKAKVELSQAGYPGLTEVNSQPSQVGSPAVINDQVSLRDSAPSRRQMDRDDLVRVDHPVSSQSIIDQTIAKFNHNPMIGLDREGPKVETASRYKKVPSAGYSVAVNTLVGAMDSQLVGSRVSKPSTKAGKSGETGKSAKNNAGKVNDQSQKRGFSSENNGEVKTSPDFKMSSNGSNGNETCEDLMPGDDKSYYTEINLMANSIRIDQDFIEARYFQFQFLDNSNYLATQNGLIKIREEIKKKVMSRSGVITAAKHIDTRVDLLLESVLREREEIDYEVPILTHEFYYSLLKTHQISEYSSALLVEIDNDAPKRGDQTDFVEVDQDDAVMLYFNERFEEIDPGSSDDYNYILFIGLKPGNTNVVYTNIDGLSTQKVIFLRENEIYFDQNQFIKLFKDRVSVCQEWLLSKVPSPLPLNIKKIEFESGRGGIRSIGVNTVQKDLHLLTLGAKKYLHLEDTSIGYWDASKLTVPSKEYKKFVLGQFEIDELDENQCVIQVNLSSLGLESMDMMGLSIASDGSNQISEHEILFLDMDGTTHSEPSEKTNKVFILGYGHGESHILLNYQENKMQSLKSFCIPGHYLVEQL